MILDHLRVHESRRLLPHEHFGEAEEWYGRQEQENPAYDEASPPGANLVEHKDECIRSVTISGLSIYLSIYLQSIALYVSLPPLYLFLSLPPSRSL